MGVDKLPPELEIDLQSNSQKNLKLITSSKESWIRWVFHSMGVMCGVSPCSRTCTKDAKNIRGMYGQVIETKTDHHSCNRHDFLIVVITVVLRIHACNSQKKIKEPVLKYDHSFQN